MIFHLRSHRPNLGGWVIYSMMFWVTVPLAEADDLASISGKGFSEQRFREELQTLGKQADMIKSNPEIRRKYLNHLVDNEILSQEAIAEKIHESQAFRQKLEAAKRDILASLYLKKEVDKETSPEKLKTYFEANIAKFSNKEVRASHILFDEKDQVKAEEVLKKALKGEDFATLAKEYSTGPSGPKGGDLSFFKRGRMVPAFDQVAFTTPKGKVHSSLVKTRFGWHIIKVTDIRGAETPDFDSKHQEVLRVRSEEVKETLMAKLRKQYNVMVNDKGLDDLKL